MKNSRRQSKRTRPANESMIAIHDRMPVIVHAGQVRSYLTDYDAAMELIARSNATLRRAPAGDPVVNNDF